MIYATRERAEWWAAELNKRLGYLPVRAWLSPQGWTIVIVNERERAR